MCLSYQDARDPVTIVKTRKPRSKKVDMNDNKNMGTIEFDIKNKQNDDKSKNSRADDISIPILPKDSGLNNNSLLSLNSMSSHLEVSSFQLQLLKIYLDFGSHMFSFNISNNVFKFWSNEVPSLWCGSDLIKNSLYALACARLLANYNHSSVGKIFINDPESKTFKKINLLKEVENYSNRSVELMNIAKLFVSEVDEEDSVDVAGQLFIAKKAITGAHLLTPKKMLEYDCISDVDIKDLQICEMMEFSADFYNGLVPYYERIKSSKYYHVLDPEVIIPPGQLINLTGTLYYIRHLRSYVEVHIDPMDIRYITYSDAISKMENNSLKSAINKFPVTLFKMIIEMAFDHDFLRMFLEKDHLSMKIIYYACCINFILHYDTYQKSDIYKEFIVFYERYMDSQFTGGFEDYMDKNIHDVVVAKRKNELPYDLEIMYQLGKPVDEFLTETKKFQQEFPSVYIG